MRNASPSAISPSNSSSTAEQQAGNAPICSGNTTCWATTSPCVFINAQDASWDSRTMVEKPVRNSEFCISCTMPERLALMTSRSTAESVVIRCPCFPLLSSSAKADDPVHASASGYEHRTLLLGLYPCKQDRWDALYRRDQQSGAK